MSEDNTLLDELLNGTTQAQAVFEHDINQEIVDPLIDEINLIQDASVREFVSLCLSKIDPIFWTASMPPESNRMQDEHEEFGIIKHTKRVVRIIKLICDAQERSAFERDIMIAAAILHDSTKAVLVDKEVNYDPMHPYTLDALALAQQTTLEVEFVHQILRLIRTHLGVWSPVPETIPVTSLEWSLHLADFISSNMEWVLNGPTPSCE